MAVESVESVDLTRITEHGLELCRRGSWKKGLEYLVPVLTETERRGEQLPAEVYSHAGYGIACYRAQYSEGLNLCKRAVELEFYKPENFLLLAKTYALRNSRRRAFEAINRGLRLDPDDLQLLALRDSLNRRRAPVLPFLPRGHPLNRLLGRLRHSLLPGRAPA